MRTVFAGKGWLVGLLAACSIFLVGAFDYYNQMPKPGDVWIVGAYCTEDADAKRLAAATAEEGNAGYMKVMADPKSKCIDSRMHPRAPHFPAIILEKGWVVEHPQGGQIQYWRVADQAGNEGWTWNPVYDAGQYFEDLVSRMDNQLSKVIQ